jgi:uncharacterized PurR-regulated membrane protein YhhQ (DUF165 family)
MTRDTARRIGLAAVVVYIGTIFGANYAIANLGTQLTPGGPHTIPVGFGLVAPSGVLFVGLALVMRDMVQFFLGRHWAVGAIIVGAALSYFVAPSLALASATAFLLSETADFAVYTPMIRRGWVVPAVFASGAVGLVVDSAVFLFLAFGSLQYIEGQVLGKLYMTAAASLVIWALRRRYPQALTAPPVAQ